MCAVCVCSIAYMYTHRSMQVQMWRSEDSLGESVLCIYRVGLRDLTQVIRFGDKGLNP